MSRLADLFEGPFVHHDSSHSVATIMLLPPSRQQLRGLAATASASISYQTCYYTTMLAKQALDVMLHQQDQPERSPVSCRVQFALLASAYL